VAQRTRLAQGLVAVGPAPQGDDSERLVLLGAKADEPACERALGYVELGLEPGVDGRPTARRGDEQGVG